MVQLTQDWDARFRAGDTPWEEDVVAPSVVDLVREHVPSEARVLEIGCGRGTTSVWLAEQGYRVVACDISPEAVRLARRRAEAAGVELILMVADALADAARLPPAEVVFTRGVLHTFTSGDGRGAFAAAVAGCLPPAGLWLDVSGSADTPDDPGQRARLGLPRLALSDVASAVEAHFEVLSVRRARYGVTPGQTDFLAWASALRRRHAARARATRGGRGVSLDSTTATASTRPPSLTGTGLVSVPQPRLLLAPSPRSA